MKLNRPLNSLGFQLFTFTLASLGGLCVASACVWQLETKSGTDPFWPSNQIEVCFLPPNPPRSPGPNPLDSEYVNHYTRFMGIAQISLQSQINARGGFELFGFGYCSDQGLPGQTLAPKIRIDLNGHQGHGARASTIGPASATHPFNVFINSHNFVWPGGIKPSESDTTPRQMVRVFNDDRHMSWVVLHEVMHLLGFHHEEYWNIDFHPFEQTARVIRLGQGADEQSIMMRSARNFDANGISQISEMDAQCLRKVADRSILLEPSQPAQREED